MSRPLARWLQAAGAVMAAASVALAAYASHGADPGVRGNLQTAAILGFGHGVALAALARGTPTRLSLTALSMLLAGSLVFAGSLVARALLGTSSATAPWGGMLLILGWLLYAACVLRD